MRKGLLMESQNILNPAIKELNPPKRMMEILAISNEKERNQQLALLACEFGFVELRPKQPPTKPEKVKEYYILSKGERRKRNDDADKYAKFWSDETVRRYFDDCGLVSIANRQNKEWLKICLSWLDPVQNPKEVKMITDRLYDFGNVDQPQEADWSEKEE